MRSRKPQLDNKLDQLIRKSIDQATKNQNPPKRAWKNIQQNIQNKRITRQRWIFGASLAIQASMMMFVVLSSGISLQMFSQPQAGLYLPPLETPSTPLRINDQVMPLQKPLSPEQINARVSDIKKRNIPETESNQAQTTSANQIKYAPPEPSLDDVKSRLPADDLLTQIQLENASTSKKSSFSPSLNSLSQIIQ